jgi:acyl carrier protein
MTNIETQIIELARQLTRYKKQEITLQSKFKEDLRLDSLSLTELIVACEETFNIEIDMDHPDTAKAKVLNDLYKAVVHLIGSNQLD